MNYNKLKLKIWVEDENGTPVASQISAGALPTLNPKDIYTLQLDWTDNIGEVQYKMLVNFIVNILAARYGKVDPIQLKYFPKLEK
jgi:hypothetical protein